MLEVQQYFTIPSELTCFDRKSVIACKTLKLAKLIYYQSDPSILLATYNCVSKQHNEYAYMANASYILHFGALIFWWLLQH